MGVSKCRYVCYVLFLLNSKSVLINSLISAGPLKGLWHGMTYNLSCQGHPPTWLCYRAMHCLTSVIFTTHVLYTSVSHTATIIARAALTEKYSHYKYLAGIVSASPKDILSRVWEQTSRSALVCLSACLSRQIRLIAIDVLDPLGLFPGRLVPVAEGLLV